MKKLLILALLSVFSAQAQESYDDISKLNSLNRTVSGIRPERDGEHYTTAHGGVIVRSSYATGAQDTLLKLPKGFHLADYSISPNGGLILVSKGATPIYRHSFTTKYYLGETDSLRSIMIGIKNTRDASISPDGRKIAVSSGNNLYIYDIQRQGTLQITKDGEWNKVINGTTDWVYEEEFGFTKGYAFSPDSRKIAYMRFDESEVPMFEMMRFDGALYNKAFSFKYPKAGEKNSTVELWVFDIESGQRHKIDVGPEPDQYIPQIGWTPDGRLYFFRLNRQQNHFEVVVNENDGSQKVVYDERSPKYVDRVTGNVVRFLDGDRFIVKQETATCYAHLYLYSIKKGLLNTITKGDWDVTSICGVKDGRLYYVSTETSPLRRNLYSIGLNGKNKKRLTDGEGFYAIAPSADMKYYIATFSDARTPNRTDIFRYDGEKVRTLADNALMKQAVDSIDYPAKEFIEIPTERGDMLNAYIVKPKDFDPSQKYPLLLTQYSGPGSQMVADKWATDWEDVLAAHGYIVVCADGRGTGFRGEEFKKSTYGDLGAKEVEDQISVARYMASQPYVDAGRIGIYGWSYGGFMALGCALKGDGLFKMAIAVAPVTSWRYYDSIYTEVYNGLPQDNAAGYDDNSPITFADRLDDNRTRLLIVHGTADDNVHFQNSMEMARALNKHGKQYDMMVYPDQNHSMQPSAMSNVRQKMIDYTLENL